MKGTSCDIDTLYDRYSRRLFHTALRIVGDAMEAEEAMQDAFLKFARMRSCPQTAPQIEAWLVKTCVRGAIDRLRRRRKRASFLSELSESGRLPAEDKSRGESGWSELLDDSAGEAAVSQ